MDMTDEIDSTSTRVVERTADLVSAYVAHNQIPQDGLPELIGHVHRALYKISSSDGPVVEERPVPAVDPKDSVKPDYVVCLEDGLKFKVLKQHLRTDHGMSVEEYRERWNLPAHHALVAPNYSAERSKLAKRLGLGRKPEAKPKKKTRRKWVPVRRGFA